MLLHLVPILLFIAVNTLLLQFVQPAMTVFESQLVPAVTELVVAELMYLQYMDPKEPIFIYINSTGTTRDDGETVIGFWLAVYVKCSICCGHFTLYFLYL